jgi:hypothetical protein
VNIGRVRQETPGHTICLDLWKVSVIHESQIRTCEIAEPSLAIGCHDTVAVAPTCAKQKITTGDFPLIQNEGGRAHPR